MLLRKLSQLAVAGACLCGLLSVSRVADADSVCITFFSGSCTSAAAGESATGSAAFGPLFGQITLTVNLEQRGANTAAVVEVWSSNTLLFNVFDFVDDGVPVSQTFIVNGVPKYVVVHIE